MKLSLLSLLFLILNSSPTAEPDIENHPVPEPTPPVKNLLLQIQSLSPSDLGIKKSSSTSRVWGVLMETGYTDQLVTLVVLADGSTNLYMGEGGGLFGLGGYKNVKLASSSMLSVANNYTTQFASTTSFTYPNIGHVKFFLLTYAGPLTAGAAEFQLENGNHQLSELFFAGKKVITELLTIDN